MLQMLRKKVIPVGNDALVVPNLGGTLPARDLNQVKAMKFKFGNGDQPLAGFTIKRGVGIGGFGEVYFATNDAGKEVAIKQIQRNLDVEVRGVRQCMNLKHPNLIALYDIQFDDAEQGWIVMEYVAGDSLRDVIEKNPTGLAADELAHWFGQIVAGVAYLHDHGIVHRDLKPANIFEDQGVVKIGDYGLSKFISCSKRGGQTESVGTFHYMAPEIGKGEYGKEIDIYALGVMLYELATGVVPFDGESSQEIIMKHLTADPDLSLLPAHLREVVGRALAKNPASRFSDVRAMLTPLGLAVDERCLLVVGRRTLPPVIAAEPPRLFVDGASRSTATPLHPTVASVKYQEPIARKLRESWSAASNWWSKLNLNSGMKTTLLVFAILFLALNAEILLSFLVLGLTFYVPYYAVWWVLRSPVDAGQGRTSPPSLGERNWPQPAKVTFHPQPVPVSRKPVAAVQRPLSVKQWRVARRQQLAQTSRRNVLKEVTGSWLGSTAVIAVFSSLAVLFQIGTGKPAQPLIMGMIWAALVALSIAWIAISFGKRWQREEGDWAIRAFMQLTSGFVIGAVAFVLAEFLMIPWNEITREQLGELPVHRWRGFFASDGTPLFPAYLAYFPLVMGLVQWWKQVDPLRRSRFSITSVIWSVIAASLVHLLIPFPQPWGALIAAGASLAIQLSSPWVNPAERLNPDSSAIA